MLCCPCDKDLVIEPWDIAIGAGEYLFCHPSDILMNWLDFSVRSTFVVMMFGEDYPIPMLTMYVQWFYYVCASGCIVNRHGYFLSIAFVNILAHRKYKCNSDELGRVEGLPKLNP